MRSHPTTSSVRELGEFRSYSNKIFRIIRGINGMWFIETIA